MKHNKEDPSRHVSDKGEAATEQWNHDKEKEATCKLAKQAPLPDLDHSTILYLRSYSEGEDWSSSAVQIQIQIHLLTWYLEILTHILLPNIMRTLPFGLDLELDHVHTGPELWC